jgi:hypothetical protein
MTVASIGRLIQDLSVFTAVRESSYVYPIVLSTHLACIATFGGLILVTDLRLLGWTLTDIPIDEMIRSLRPWKQLGFTIMVTCGALLGASKAEDYLTNPYFAVKMALLVAVGLHGLYFRRTVYRRAGSPISPSTARVAGALSLVLWVGVVSMGRWIAYYDRPSPEARVSPSAATSVRLPTTTCEAVVATQISALGAPMRIMNSAPSPSATCTSTLAIAHLAAALSPGVANDSWVIATAGTRMPAAASPPTSTCQTTGIS